MTPSGFSSFSSANFGVAATSTVDQLQELLQLTHGAADEAEGSPCSEATSTSHVSSPVTISASIIDGAIGAGSSAGSRSLQLSSPKDRRPILARLFRSAWTWH
jgi:hypothetical protein